MKSKIMLFLILSLTICAFSQFQYEKVITLVTAQNQPYPIAVDSNGGLYFGTFMSPTSTNNGAFYIADPVNNPTNISTIATYTDFPSGRGIQGIAVDSAKNVYVSGDTGTTNNSIVKKYGPPPTFTPNATFVPDVSGTRLLSCTLFNDSYIATNSFTGVRVYSTSDGTMPGSIWIDNTTTYQRQIVINPLNNDMILTRNGNGAGGSVLIYSGGSAPGNLAGYTSLRTDFITDIQTVSDYGNAAQGLYFYALKNYLLVNIDTGAIDDAQGRLNIYEISGTGAGATATLKYQIDGTESGTQLSDQIDAVIYKSGNIERLYITDYANNRIVVYKWDSTPSAGVTQTWSIYE